ncbi:MAG: transposase, partial [Clostridia bacterium]|nr:transposase [Clostridia bacterium]
IYTYVFKKDQCTDCPYRDRCIGKTKGKAKKLRVTASAPIFYEINQEQKKPEFKEKYKKRASIEWKNAEMKHLHGMARARGWGKRSVTFQIKLTAIAVNLKRIAAIMAKQEAESGCNALPVAVGYTYFNDILSSFLLVRLKQVRLIAY